MKTLNKKIMMALLMNLIGFSANAVIYTNPVDTSRVLKAGLWQQKEAKNQKSCLRLIGSAVDANGNRLSGIGILLLKDNDKLVQQKFVAQDDAGAPPVFFDLSRNAHYSVLVTKEGYVPRLISISTELPNDVVTMGNGFVFEFEVELPVVSDTDDEDYLDFPIALISYDPVNRLFENHDNYTEHIKEKIHHERVEITVVEN